MAGMLDESQNVCMYAGDAVCPIAVLLSEFTAKLEAVREWANMNHENELMSILNKKDHA